MADESVKKVDSDHSPQGKMGQTYLAEGKKLAMRLWRRGPGEDQQKDEHTRPYETVGYVIEGRAELYLGDQKIMLEAGDSWVVPENARHTYRILEAFQAIEATAPPARAHARDRGIKAMGTGPFLWGRNLSGFRKPDRFITGPIPP